FTAPASKAAPSVKVTPCRRCRVRIFPPWEKAHFVANIGLYSSLGPTWSNRSYTGQVEINIPPPWQTSLGSSEFVTRYPIRSTASLSAAPPEEPGVPDGLLEPHPAPNVAAAINAVRNTAPRR